MAEPSPEQFIARWRAASYYRDENRRTLGLIYRYLFPHRVAALDQSVDEAMRASSTSFAKTRVREFASRILSGTTPLFQQWIKYQVPKRADLNAQQKARSQTEVNKLNTELWRMLGKSAWTTRFGQLISDIGIGIGCILIEPDPREDRFRIEVEPMANMAVEIDAWGHFSAYFRERRRTARQIEAKWGKQAASKIPRDPGRDESFKYDTIEGVVRDTTEEREEVWHRVDILRFHQGGEQYTEVLYKSDAMRGAGACPWIGVRWDASPENWWGYGPIWDILPEVMAANEMRSSSISHAKLAALGVWQVDDDNTVNARNLKLRPGMIVPVQPNSRGLQPLQLPGRPDVAMFEQREFKENVDRALYLDRLGPVQGTPMSATEVIERQAELGRVIGLPYGRIIEGMEQIVTRMHYIMREQKKTESLPDELQPEFMGPFARAQRLEEALAIREGIQIIAQTVGDPQLMPAVVDIFKSAQRIAELLNFPADLIRDQQGAASAAQELGPLLQALQSNGGSAPALPGSAPGPR